MWESLPLSFLYRVGSDLWSRYKGHRLSPGDVARLREKWQEVFQQKMLERRKAQRRSDVIIRDVRRMDDYPQIERAKGISPWFRVGLVSTYHRGIQVFLAWEALCRTADGGWRYAADGEAPDITAALLGSIKYERIESVVWDGDEFYPYPHIYCHFIEKDREPYERVAFYEHMTLSRGGDHFKELVERAHVRRP